MDRNARQVFLVTIFLFLFYTGELLFAEDGIIFRPHIGYGYSDSEGEYGGSLSHVGGRLLLGVSEDRTYGLELTHFKLDKGNSFTSAGIILEQRLWNWFNMSIGTVGYFGYGVDSDNSAGLTAGLGWEPADLGDFKPFVIYRNDLVFHKRKAAVSSLSVGLGWQF